QLSKQQEEKTFEDDKSNKMRRKIISLVYEMNWAKPKDWKAAIKSINTFMAGTHSLYNKELNKLTYKELIQVVSQFEQMHIKYLKGI
ncbi:MAG: hypothetical protein ABUT20_48250, partial [Bacteroidota bacterium]